MLFKSLIRPHLEFSNCIWGPFSKGDQKLVERVQHRATKLVPELRMKPYSTRLRLLDLPALTYCWLCGDMIVIYQILHDAMNVHDGLIRLSETRITQSHGPWPMASSCTSPRPSPGQDETSSVSERSTAETVCLIMSSLHPLSIPSNPDWTPTGNSSASFLSLTTNSYRKSKCIK